MTFVCYTSCESGHRHFTCLTGVAVSYDPRFIEYLIQCRREHMESVAQTVRQTEQGVIDHDMQEKLAPMLAHNNKVIGEMRTWTKRMTTAEASINGELVRNVMYFQKREQAIAYSRGTA